VRIHTINIEPAVACLREILADLSFIVAHEYSHVLAPRVVRRHRVRNLAKVQRSMSKRTLLSKGAVLRLLPMLAQASLVFEPLSVM